MGFEGISWGFRGFVKGFRGFHDFFISELVVTKQTDMIARGIVFFY